MMKDLDLANGTTSGSSGGVGKIRLATGCKKSLMAELRADTKLLAGLGVMDYSLLVRRLIPIPCPFFL